MILMSNNHNFLTYLYFFIIIYFKKTIENMSEPVIKVNQSYPTFSYILLPIITMYCGLFLAISNHFVLKSKIQSFLQRALISSDLVRELIIDLLSSMSFITYALSAYLLTPASDQHMSILCVHDILWLTLYLAVLSYKNVSSQQNVCNIMLSKNLIFLSLCYVNVIYHYFSNTKLISLPASLIGLYFINLLINAYENRFKGFILELLGLAEQPQISPIPKCVSKMQDIESLAHMYPISPKEIQNKISTLSCKNVKKVSAVSSLDHKLDTKVIVRMKLLQMALCIHLSYKKLEQDEVQAVNEYFGSLNGTLTKSSKTRVLGQKKPQNQKINNHEDYVKQEDYMTGNLIIKNTMNEQQCSSSNHNSENREKIQLKTYLQAIQSSSLLFYIFPVRIFQSSKIIANMFSVFINLGFGVLLNYSINITSTLSFGGYFNLLHAFLLLPYLPNISPIEYLNTMALSSIWKYGVLGVFCTISIGSFSDDHISIKWNFNKLLQYQYLLILICLLIVSVSVIKNLISFKVFLAIFGISLIAEGGIQYLKVVPLKV